MDASTSTRTSPATTRVRRRSIAVPVEPVNTTPVLPAAIAASVAEFVRLNGIANEAKQAADKAKKEVENALRAEDLAGVAFDVDTPSGLYEAGILPSTTAEVDINELAKHVDMATFVKIVKAAQKDVSDAAGKTVLAKCLRDVTKAPAIKISKKKVVN